MTCFKRVITAVLLLLTSSAFAAIQITGAGSSFIYPVLAKWADAYKNISQIQVNYQPIGSGGGIRAIEEQTVTFAATDKPLTLAALHQYKLAQAPMIVGGIVPVVHISGVKNNVLVLSGAVLADIYMGKITKWNDPEIKKLNPELALPNAMIITIHRSDGSGTTYNFTNYLAKVSNAWKQNVGFDTLVSWPGNGIGAKGNAGVASQVRNLPNSIGYVEYAYAIQNDMATVCLKNQAGRIVKPSGVTFASAAENAQWRASDGYHLILTNQPGVTSWPIVATTFVLIPKNPDSAAQRDQALKFLIWSYQNGRSMAQNLDYVAIPPVVYKKIIANWHRTFKIN